MSKHLRMTRQPEVQTQERYKKILDALKEEELRNPDLIKAREKQRIAAHSGEVRASEEG